MDTLKLRYKTVVDALASLEIIIKKFDKYAQTTTYEDNELAEMSRIYRDSLIQRFEYSTDLFWKYAKKYLEEKLSIFMELNGPAEVIRAGFSAGLLHEDEAENILDMIKDRNRTSHIYHEEIAAKIAGRVPEYKVIMSRVIERMVP